MFINSKLLIAVVAFDSISTVYVLHNSKIIMNEKIPFAFFLPFYEQNYSMVTMIERMRHEIAVTNARCTDLIRKF